jgi:phage tail-like protein
MAFRNNPYSAFKFTVKLGDLSEDGFAGGFSDVSGLANDVKYAEYRNGNESDNHPRKIPNTNTVDDVTLKRGVIGDLRLFTWLKDTREGRFQPRTIVITLHDEQGTQVCSWTLLAAQPKKWVGPTLAGKGGTDVAMEELHLVAEQIEFQSL